MSNYKTTLLINVINMFFFSLQFLRLSEADFILYCQVQGFNLVIKMIFWIFTLLVLELHLDSLLCSKIQKFINFSKDLKLIINNVKVSIRKKKGSLKGSFTLNKLNYSTYILTSQ